MSDQKLHLVVTPAEHLSNVDPPVIFTCTMFKTGATLIVRADATSEDIDMEDMLDMAYGKLKRAEQKGHKEEDRAKLDSIHRPHNSKA